MIKDIDDVDGLDEEDALDYPSEVVVQSTGRLPRGATPIARDIRDLPESPRVAAKKLGLNEDTVALWIDANLDQRVWEGTQMRDRALKVSEGFRQTLLGQVNQSMFDQDNYDDFEARLLERLGINAENETAGPLRNMLTDLSMENRIAWSAGLKTANAQDDTVLVWKAVLDSSTTQFCWNAHGLLIDEVGELPPHHFGCRCSPLSIPSIYSANLEWAAMGAAIIDEMREERDSGDAVNESAPPVPEWLVSRTPKQSRLMTRILEAA